MTRSLNTPGRDHQHAVPAGIEFLYPTGAECAVSVVDQEPRRLEEAGEAQVARLPRDPGAGWVGCAAREVDRLPSSMKQERSSAQSDRLDGEEVARQNACRLLAQKRSPAWSVAPRRGRQTGRQQKPPDDAQRDARRLRKAASLHGEAARGRLSVGK